MSNQPMSLIAVAVLGLALLGGTSACRGPVVGAPCADDFEPCPGGCFDFDIDAQNCGGCGNVCAAGEACLSGQCTLCPPGTEECDGECVVLDDDPLHCGGCGVACADYQSCEQGQCVGCPPGTELCDGECVDLQSDDDHCGDCSVACGAGEECLDGACVLDCAEPLELCDGACVDLEDDPLNCGACGNACPSETPVCLDGACVIECPEGTDYCDGECVDLLGDQANCGECGNACGDGHVCDGGECLLDCGDGLVDCGGECVDLLADHDHCGECETSCSADEICAAGECIPDCGTLSWCDDACVDTNSDNLHCGGCDSPCDEGWLCVDGSCAITCPEPFTSCGDVCVDLTGNPLHCGECGNACDSGICFDGECAVESAGHLIGIGHDYSESHAMLRRLLGNSVFIFPYNPVQILAYEEFADDSPGGQIDQVDEAIATEAELKGRSFEKTSAPDSTYVAEHLLDFDVLLVYRQGEASTYDLYGVGNELYGPLRDFLSVGGIVVFTDGPGAGPGTYEIFETANLFDCSGTVDATGSTAEVVVFGDAVAQGLSLSYLASSNSVSFATDEEQAVVVVEGTDDPLVVHKVVLPE